MLQMRQLSPECNHLQQKTGAIKELHSWDLSPKEAILVQDELKKKLSTDDCLDAVDLIAGVDCAYSKEGRTLYAGVVIVKLPSMQLVDSGIACEEVRFPYIRGLLSFREGPITWQTRLPSIAIEAPAEKLQHYLIFTFSAFGASAALSIFSICFSIIDFTARRSSLLAMSRCFPASEDVKNAWILGKGHMMDISHFSDMAVTSKIDLEGISDELRLP